MSTNEYNAGLVSAYYRARIYQWIKVRDVLEGEDRVKARRRLYLERPQGMPRNEIGDRAYRDYVMRSSFYGAATRTLEGLCGMAMRIEPDMTNIPAGLSYMMDQAATPDGAVLLSMIEEMLRASLSIGRIGVLVEMPKTPGPPKPFFAIYNAEDIFNWCYSSELDPEGKKRLERVCLREVDDDGNESVRELCLDESGNYIQRVFKKRAAAGSAANKPAAPWSDDFDSVTMEDLSRLSEAVSGLSSEPDETILPVLDGKPLKYIPLVMVDSSRVMLPDNPPPPPMLELANTVLSHYRNSADYEHALYLTAQPTPYALGFAKAPPVWGSGTVWHSNKADAKVGLIEYEGKGVSSIRDAMNDKIERMKVLGAGFVIGEDQSNVTAETTRMQGRSQTSVLLTAVRQTENGVRRLIAIAAEWMGTKAAPDSVTLNRDFIETRLTPEEITAMVGAWQAGAYSRQTLFDNLKRGEIIPAERTYAEEMEMLDGETPPRGMEMEDGAGDSGDSDSDDAAE